MIIKVVAMVKDSLGCYIAFVICVFECIVFSIIIIGVKEWFDHVFFFNF